MWLWLLLALLLLSVAFPAQDFKATSWIARPFKGNESETVGWICLSTSLGFTNGLLRGHIRKHMFFSRLLEGGGVGGHGGVSFFLTYAGCKGHMFFFSF